ncbi:MAG: DUF4307 domain-containing protein [Pseudonocardiales bacterium]|nr:MAG: DUF4307 domain-containing protein [Pseudonocardiales bacterium]
MSASQQQPPGAVPPAPASLTRPPPRRRNVWLLGGVVLLISLGIAIVGYRNYGRHPIDAQVTAYHVTDRSVRVTFDLTRNHGDRPVTCVLRALDRTGAVIGRTTLHVPAGSAETSERGTVRTPARAVVGEVESCSYDAR